MHIIKCGTPNRSRGELETEKSQKLQTSIRKKVIDIMSTRRAKDWVRFGTIWNRIESLTSFFALN